MHGACATYQSSNSGSADPLSIDGSIGDLFRLYGEEYIRIYRPNLHQIKFIRAVRLCKTPALGGHAIKCNNCGHRLYIYHSCGHSQCPCCQSIKRAQWQDRLSNRLLKVPYTHTVFTLPHQLNVIARKYPKEIYNLLLRSAWQTVKTLSADPSNLGAIPGMVSILHTFGSDLKYHLHCHTLITFGGLNNNQWIWPRRKKKIASFREMCREFRSQFLVGLDEIIASLEFDNDRYKNIRNEIESIRWNVRSSYPTMQTELIENYLARYIVKRSRKGKGPVDL